MVAALPPAAKLSLMDRKDIRDNWESNKSELERTISGLLGVPWTIEVDPLTIAPYTTDRAGQLGCIINGYMDAVPSQLEWFLKDGGDLVKEALNNAAPKHVLSLAVDEDDKYSYCGPAIRDGILYITFKHDSVWVNVNDSLEKDAFLDVIDKAEAAGGAGDAPALSATVKSSIARSYEPEIAAVEKDIRAILKNDSITLNPNWAAINAGLAAADSPPSDWQKRIGTLGFAYFDAIPFSLKSMKFDSDDMLQEAFTEAVSKNEIALRLLDPLPGGASYCEPQVEDGVLYINIRPAEFGTNVGDGLSNLVNALDDAL